MRKLPLLILSILILHLFSITVYGENENSKLIDVKRNIEIYPGFLIVKDSVNLLSKTDKLVFYLTRDEYVSLYTLDIQPNLPILQGEMYEDMKGYGVSLKDNEKLTIIRVYDYKLFFGDTVENTTIILPAYFLSDYKINYGNATVKFFMPIQALEIKSPAGANKTLLANGTYIINYNFNNLTSINKTSLEINFKIPNNIPWFKVANMSRIISIEDENYLKVVDEIKIEHIGKDENINKFIYNGIKNSNIIEVKDNFGNLKFNITKSIDRENAEILLRNPSPLRLVRPLYFSFTVISKVKIDSLGNINLNTGEFNIILNLFEENNLLIDRFQLIIDSSLISNLKLEPLPDISLKENNKIYYGYVFEKVYPGFKTDIRFQGRVNLYFNWLNIVNQILILVIISLSLIYFIARRTLIPLKEEKKVIQVPLIKRYLELYEKILLNNEELDNLEEKIKKGEIKKSEYNRRISLLKSEINKYEKEAEKLSKEIIENDKSLIKIISELNLTYKNYVKKREELAELIRNYNLHKISSSTYSKLYREILNEIQKNKSKIGGIINELAEKYK